MLHSWPAPFQALTLVISPKLGLQQNLFHLLWNHNVKLNLCNHHNKFECKRLKPKRIQEDHVNINKRKLAKKKMEKRKFSNGVLKMYYELT
jgi:hypothetical protein